MIARTNAQVAQRRTKRPVWRGFGTVSKPLPKLRVSVVNFRHPKPAETAVKLRRNHSETEPPVSAETVLMAPPYRGPQRFGFGFADFPTRHRERVYDGISNPRGNRLAFGALPHSGSPCQPACRARLD